MTELLLDIEQELRSEWEDRIAAAELAFNLCKDETIKIKNKMDKLMDAGETDKAVQHYRQPLLDLIAKTDIAVKSWKAVANNPPFLIALAEMTDEEVLRRHKLVLDDPASKKVLGADFMANTSADEVRALARKLELLKLKKKMGC